MSADSRERIVQTSPANTSRPGISRVQPQRAPGSRALARMGSWRTQLIAAALVGVATTAIVWARTPALARATLWAEDGRVFLSGAAADASPVKWFTPYEGYLHVVPRIAADLIAHLVPIAQWATATTLATAVIIGAIGAGAVWLARDAIPMLVPRVGLGLVPGVIACAPFEVAGNLANVHTYFMWLTPWLLLHRARSRWGAITVGIVAGIGSFSEIQMVAFIPLFLWKFRDARFWPARIGLILGLAAQITATVLSPRASPPNVLRGPGDVLLGYVVQGVGGLWWSHPTTIGHYALTLPILLVVACLPPAIAIAYVLRRGNAVQRVATLALAGGSAAVWSAGYEANPLGRPDYASLTQSEWMSLTFLRYATGAAMLLAATMPVAFGIAIERSRVVTGPSRRPLLGALITVVPTLVLILVLGRAFTAADSVRASGPAWRPQATALEATCAPADVPAVRSVRGSVAPGPKWDVTLTCGFVRAHDGAPGR